jgi:Holliday junction resolvase RusA-like endonuclease
MRGLSFFCPCIPPTTTHHAKRIVRVGRFSRLADKPELVQARTFLETVLQPHQPSEPVAGQVCLALTFTWPWLASHSKKVRVLGRIPKRSKPDCSNLGKTIEDRLAALRFIEADENVVDLHVRKFFGDEPGIDVRIVAVDALTRTANRIVAVGQPVNRRFGE